MKCLYQPLFIIILILFSLSCSHLELKEVLGDDGTCPDFFTDSRDLQVYSAKNFGNACWMTKNLNHGVWIKHDTSEQNFDNGKVDKFCWDDDPSNCDIFGGFYTWEEATGYGTTLENQGICPDGWHIPSRNEWDTLLTNLGVNPSEFENVSNPGWIGSCLTLESMKSDNWSIVSGPARDNPVPEGCREKRGESGFDAIATGLFHRTTITQSWSNIGNAFWWTADPISKTDAYSFSIQFNTEVNRDMIRRTNHSRTKFKLSVRCVKD